MTYLIHKREAGIHNLRRYALDKSFKIALKTATWSSDCFCFSPIGSKYKSYYTNEGESPKKVKKEQISIKTSRSSSKI